MPYSSSFLLQLDGILKKVSLFCVSMAVGVSVGVFYVTCSIEIQKTWTFLRDRNSLGAVISGKNFSVA